MMRRKTTPELFFAKQNEEFSSRIRKDKVDKREEDNRSETSIGARTNAKIIGSQGTVCELLSRSRHFSRAARRFRGILQAKRR
jgi:hypothetical protein